MPGKKHANVVQRKCLACDKEFPSQAPEVRICVKCRNHFEHVRTNQEPRMNRCQFRWNGIPCR